MVRIAAATLALGAISVIAAPGNPLIPRNEVPVPRGCGSHVPAHKVIQYEKNFKAMKKAQSFAAVPDEPSGPIDIPVYWHVISQANGTDIADGNLPDSQIEAQIDVLNKDYASKSQGTLRLSPSGASLSPNHRRKY